MNKDIPALFQGAMVCAMLDGRKTETRRLLKPQPEIFDTDEGPAKVWVYAPANERPRVAIGSSKASVITTQEVRFAIGDRLWVREAWTLHSRASDVVTIVYGATVNRSWTETHNQFPAHLARDVPAIPFQQGLRPSIHLLRRFSRLTLIVTRVRIERLQEISEDDARAEGVVVDAGCYAVPGLPVAGPGDARTGFQALWRHIHPEKIRVKREDGKVERIDNPARWDANPFVTPVTFTVHKINIDALNQEAAA